MSGARPDPAAGPRWIVEGELLVCFCAAGRVDALLWSRLCEALAAAAVRSVLFASIGAVELDGTQRDELSEALCAGEGTRLAVVSDEALVRGTMTAMSWRRRVDQRLFIWHKLADAHAYLAPPGVDTRGLARQLEQLQQAMQAGAQAR